jgi:hypothetical protein
LKLGNSPDGTAGGCLRFVRRHAGGDVFFDEVIEVEAKLSVEFVLYLPAAEK